MLCTWFCSLLFFKAILFVYLFGGKRQREKERIPRRFHTEHGALRGVRSCDPEIMT